MKAYGWHIAAKECADFCNCSFFLIMDTPALEVAGIMTLMVNKAIYNSHG